MKTKKKKKSLGRNYILKEAIEKGTMKPKIVPSKRMKNKNKRKEINEQLQY